VYSEDTAWGIERIEDCKENFGKPISWFNCSHCDPDMATLVVSSSTDTTKETNSNGPQCICGALSLRVKRYFDNMPALSWSQLLRVYGEDATITLVMILCKVSARE
jgi:hypothetical protein